ncbi:MAG TPA: outer membrane beta-barrel protein, partial [Bacteroidales bacterium]|nr:outer membrane beta-barrel protein [Bacteroidales bacterium]
YNNDIIFGKNKNTFSFLDIPIEIGYKMPIGNVSVFGQVGPYVSVALAGRSRTIVTIEDPEPWMEDEEHSYSLYEEGYEYYKRFDTGLSVAAGVDFKQYQLRVNYAFGLSDFIANEYTKAHISSFSLTAAYLFGRNY